MKEIKEISIKIKELSREVKILDKYIDELAIDCNELSRFEKMERHANNIRSITNAINDLINK